MSDPVLDALAESALNRGLKLVRSRIRTPGKRRFGKVGLADETGKPLFGMDAKGPTAEPEEVEDYLRNLDAKDWGSSLDVALMPRRKKPGKHIEASEHGAVPAESVRAVRPPPIPEPAVRQAKPKDADALVALMKLLGHDADAKGVRKRIAALTKRNIPQLVATLDKQVVGLIGIHTMTAIHRDQPVGRITILVVAEAARGQQIGRMLVDAAEQLLKKLGCGMVEVTSNDRLTEARAFYRHMGYERSSIRFYKKL